MTTEFELRPMDPHVASYVSSSSSTSIVALEIETKIQFVTADGSVAHEYIYPSDRDIQNCGGYVDKLIKYRSAVTRSEVRDFIKGRLEDPALPVLKGRSILVDVLLTKLINRFAERFPSERAKLFDHGCTVGEHYEMIDQMLSASSGRSARDCLSYFGLDYSSLALSGARVLNHSVPEQQFKLILAEGSDIDLPSNAIDFSMSVGVVNHVHNSTLALQRLLDISRFGVVVVVWVTGEPKGFWAVNHSGIANYFFAASDLQGLADRFRDKGRFYYANFTPEDQSTQTRSYVGLSESQASSIASYTLVFCHPDFVVDGLSPLDFGVSS